jgi:hypothetical protein
MWYLRLTCSIILDTKRFHQVSSISLFLVWMQQISVPKRLLLSNNSIHRWTLYDDTAVNSWKIYILWKNDCKLYTPWHSTQTVPLPSFPTEYHTVSQCMHNCKYSLPSVDFHELTSTISTICRPLTKNFIQTTQ